MSTEERHWTNDPQLIERFVLRKMNPAERNELEDHLRVCEVCKRAVRAEQVLVAGIRRNGREKFKAELNRKISILPVEEKKTPWAQILSAAAVIVILLTVGIYNRWFETRNGEIPATSPSREDVERQAVQPQSENTHSPEQKTEERQTADEIATQAPSAAESRPSPTVSGSVEQEIRKAASSPRDAAPSPGKMKTETYAGRPVVGRSATGTAAGQENAGAGHAVSEATAITDAEPLWLEGTLSQTESDALRRGTSDAVQPESEPRKADDVRDNRVVFRSTIKDRQSRSSPSVVIIQQHSLALSASQRIQQQNASSRVVTKFEQAGNRTQLTLFLDSLIDERELANATIETPQADSLILNMARQRIAYRIPAAWNRRIQMQNAK